MKKILSIVVLVLMCCCSICAAQSNPTISIISHLEIFEDQEPEPISLTITHAEGLTSVSVSASSSNTALVKNDNIRLDGAYRLLLIQPEHDQYGQTIITLTASNTENLTTISSSFILTVLSVNDPPEFIPGESIQITSTTEPQVITNWAKDISPGNNESEQSISFEIETDLPHMFDSLPQIDMDGTLRFTPAQDSAGIAEVLVYIQDNGGTDNNGIDKSEPIRFTIEISEPYIPPPAFTIGEDITVIEDSGLTEIQNWLSITKTEDNNQGISFIVNTNKSELFETEPHITKDGMISFQPVPDGNGIANATVVLVTDGGVEAPYESEPQTFTISVLPVNDPPSFIAGGNHFEFEDSEERTYAWASQISAGPSNESNQTLTFHVQDIDTPELFEILPSFTPEGVVNYKLAKDAYGSAQIQLYIQDSGGTQNNGIDVSETKTFTLEIFAVNDCPSFMVTPELTVQNRSGKVSFDQLITDISMGENESEQTGQFEISVNQENLFEELPRLSENNQLSFTPNPYSSGTAVITLSLTDNGGTDRNGCNTIQKSIAVHIEPTRYTLTIRVQGEGSIQVNDQVLNETSLESAFIADDHVSVEAIPLSGWFFSHWSECLTQTTSIVDLVMNDHKTLIANFSSEPKFLTVKGKGWVSLKGEYYKLPFSHEFDLNEQVELEAIAPFSHWSGDITGPSNEVSLTMNTDKDIYAHFIHTESWNAALKIVSHTSDDANRQDVQSEDEIAIGVDDEARNVLDIQPPVYQCRMFIFSPDDEEYLSERIFMEGQDAYQWNIAINPHGNLGEIQTASNVKLTWQPFEFFIDGQFQLVEGFDADGDVIIEDMTAVNEYSITGNAVQFYTIRWIRNSYTFDLEEGWNLISLPLVPENPDLSQIFPDSEVAYAYIDGSYEVANQLEPGRGYWINIPQNDTYTLYGSPFSELTLSLSTGWHMLGALSTTSIPTTTMENVISVIFLFKGGTYAEVNEMTSSLGYWVNVTEACELTLDKNVLQ